MEGNLIKIEIQVKLGLFFFFFLFSPFFLRVAFLYWVKYNSVLAWFWNTHEPNTWETP